MIVTSPFKAARDPSFVPSVFFLFQFRVAQIRMCNRIAVGSGSATQGPEIRSPEMSLCFKNIGEERKSKFCVLVTLGLVAPG